MEKQMTLEEVQFIASLNNEIDPTIANWALSLINEGRSIREVKEAMKRMIDYIQRHT
jgi:hypothetical protein